MQSKYTNLITISSMDLQVECPGNTTVNLRYGENKVIVFYGYSTRELRTTDMVGQIISVASDMKITEKWWSYIDQKFIPRCTNKIEEVLRSCGITHIVDDLYKLPTIDFERKERTEEKSKKWWDDRKQTHMIKRQEIATVVKAHIDIIEDEQIKSTLQKYFFEGKGIFDIGDDTTQLEVTRAEINKGVQIIYDHIGEALNNDDVWGDTC